MTAVPPPGQNPYGSAPPPQHGAYPPPGAHGQQGAYGQQNPYGQQNAYGQPNPYGAPQGAPVPSGAGAPLAEWWERLVARIIDGLIFGVVNFILTMILVSVAGVVLGGILSALIAFGGYAAYDYVLHSKDGQTIGKKVMKIQLVGIGGAPLDSQALMKRSALYPGAMALYGIPFVNYLVMLFVLATGIFVLIDKPLQQGLHDKIAGTVVVKLPR